MIFRYALEASTHNRTRAHTHTLKTKHNSNKKKSNRQNARYSKSYTMQGQSTDGLLGLHCRHAKEGSVKRALCSCTKHAHDKTRRSGVKKKMHQTHKNTRKTQKEPPSLPHGSPAKNIIHNLTIIVVVTVQATRTNAASQTRLKLGRCVQGGGSARNHAPKGVVRDSPRSELARTERKRGNRQHRETTAKNEKSKTTAGGRDNHSNNTTHAHTKLNSALAGASWPFAL